MTRPCQNWSTLLTPPGAGAIGVIRIGGPGARSILAKLFRSAATDAQAARNSAPEESCDSLFADDRLRFGKFLVNDEVVDEVLVSQVRAEDPPVFDISAHGGIGVVESILRALEGHGAPFRDADDTAVPSWPAHDLIDKEVVSALGRAKTERAVRFLAWQRQPLLSGLQRAALLCSHDSDRAGHALRAMLAGYETARTLIEGATVVIHGPPNSGKSTLFNRLVGRSATIVSPTAGTTRDWVAASIEIDGVPLTLVDTAGRHESPGQLERHAMERGWVIAEQADLSLLLLDGSQPVNDSVREMCEDLGSGKHRGTVINKSDLKRAWEWRELSDKTIEGGGDPIFVSARTGTGLDRLTRWLLREFGFGGWVDKTPCFFAPRQRDMALCALSELTRSPAEAGRIIDEQLIGAQDA